MCCTFQKARNKDLEHSHHREMISVWEEKKIYPDLNIIQCTYALNIVQYLTNICKFYVLCIG